jgi:hypothetical protein
MAQTEAPDLDTVEHAGRSAANVAKALKGIDFPATKDELVKWAREHNADKEVIDMLRKLPS